MRALPRPGLVILAVATWACLLGPGARGDDALEALAERLDVEIRMDGAPICVPGRHGAIQAIGATPRDAAGYVPLFAREFALYPPGLVRRSRLRRVVFCLDLTFGGQRRNAVPDYDHDALYLDVRRGRESPDYLRKVIHHEFFHLIDYRDDGLVYEDRAWSALNPEGFAYGDGGRAVQGKSTTSVPTDAFPGFFNHYATTGVEEDKAEVFAHLMVDPSYVAARARKDPALAAKVARMKELLAEFDPEVDADFWPRIPRRAAR